MSRTADATPATRADIKREVELIEPLDNSEQQCQSAVLDWIDSGAQLCRLQKPAMPPKHLIAYCVLVDGDHILLVDHTNAELWLPTGGHVDPGEHPRAPARRELHEELGIEYGTDIGAPIMLSVSETVVSANKSALAAATRGEYRATVHLRHVAVAAHTITPTQDNRGPRQQLNIPNPPMRNKCRLAINRVKIGLRN